MIFGVMGVRQCLEPRYGIYYVTGMLTGTLNKCIAVLCKYIHAYCIYVLSGYHYDQNLLTKKEQAHAHIHSLTLTTH